MLVHPRVDQEIEASLENHDSILDVVVTDPERAEFLLYRGDHDVGLQGPEFFPGFKDMRKLCIGDLQGKGHDAVIALSVDEKLIGISQLQKGRLSFPKMVDIEGKPLAMEVADLNGDGKLDLAYISQEKKEREDVYSLRTVMSVGSPEAAASRPANKCEMGSKDMIFFLNPIRRNSSPDIPTFAPTSKMAST